jgi:hypothetical protein
MNILQLVQKNSSSVPEGWLPDSRFINYQFSPPERPSGMEQTAKPEGQQVDRTALIVAQALATQREKTPSAE